MKLKKQSFITGALILMISNTISKILGAVFKIPLTYIIGEEGMAVYNTAFNIYIMFLSFIVSGLPFAVSKSVSEYSSKNEPHMVRQTVKFSNTVLCIAGLIGSFVLYFGADFFALAMKEEKAVLAIKMISPSIFLVAAGTTVRSYYQGISNMVPTAISQVIEAVTKLAVGYALAVYFIEYGINAASGGAIMGVTIGEAVATSVFLIIYAFSSKSSKKCTPLEKKEIRTTLFELAIPLLCASVIGSMLSVVDTTVIRSGLIKSGLPLDAARRVYGSYTGYALTVFHLPVGILGTLGVSILPVIAGNTAIGNTKKASAAAGIALKLTILFSLPCAVIIYFMSNELLEILFKNSAAASMLSMIAPCLIMICISNILSSMLQSGGRIISVFLYSALGMILKIALSIVLMPTLGIYGAIAAANISNWPVMILNLCEARKYIGLRLSMMEDVIKPTCAASVMAVIVYLLKEPFTAWILNPFLYTAAICVVALAGYVIMLLLLFPIEQFKIIIPLKSKKLTN